jgi:hypothetical protein
MVTIFIIEMSGIKKSVPRSVSNLSIFVIQTHYVLWFLKKMTS